MTKKHFIELANAIRNEQMHNGGENTVTIETLADFCQSQNPNFNRGLWLAYIAGECGPSGGKI